MGSGGSLGLLVWILCSGIINSKDFLIVDGLKKNASGLAFWLLDAHQ